MPLEFLQTILRHIDRLIVFFIVKPFGLFRPCQQSLDATNRQNAVYPVSIMRSLHDFQLEVRGLFSEPCNMQRMLQMSGRLKQEYIKKLKSGTECMLPSFCHTLPSGQERGTYIALDVGGSTFRVALVQLSSRDEAHGGMKIRHMTVNKINEDVRRLPSDQFFSWMAVKIQVMLQQCSDERLILGETIPLGLAWSFPIEQTGPQGGKIQPMGKGFKAHEGVLGEDLGQMIEVACHRIGLSVRVNAIVNDSSATLLSQAYKDPNTSMALILGTGTNAAVNLPVKSLGKVKFGMRDQSWFEQAERVIINTEVSMFGKHILPETRWDQQLNLAHVLPDFQPLEYMTTGRYLGEILRLIIQEAVDSCQLFDGVMPGVLLERYSLDTAILAAIEADTTTDCVSSAEMLQKDFALQRVPTAAEMGFLREAVEGISHRAAAYMATALHALWSLEHERGSIGPSKTSVAANGSVVLMYPGFREGCEKHVADLITLSHPSPLLETSHELVIVPTEEATILGVAVAVAVNDGT